MKNHKLQSAIEKIKLALNALEVASIEGDGELCGVIPIERLIEFKKMFEKVLALLSENNLPQKIDRHLGIARIVVDQWPLDLKLGKILIDAEQSYVEL